MTPARRRFKPRPAGRLGAWGVGAEPQDEARPLSLLDVAPSNGRWVGVVEDHDCPRPDVAPDWAVWECQCGQRWRFEPGLGGPMWFHYPREPQS